MAASDCHGWSATPMYEIVREIVEIRYPIIEDGDFGSTVSIDSD